MKKVKVWLNLKINMFCRSKFQVSWTTLFFYTCFFIPVLYHAQRFKCFLMSHQANIRTVAVLIYHLNETLVVINALMKRLSCFVLDFVGVFNFSHTLKQSTGCSRFSVQPLFSWPTSSIRALPSSLFLIYYDEQNLIF